MTDILLNFPRGFIWGSTTSSHQVEGNNNNNNWFAWEKAGNIPNRQSSGAACEWWSGRWREDFDRAVEIGQNAFRLSLEWSRIQPNPDRWDEGVLDHYRQIIQGLHERGLKPFVTLHHFSEPLWFSELGGWQNELAINYYIKYVKKTVQTLKEYVNWWCTLNEPSYFATQAYLLGSFPPGKRNLLSVYNVMLNLIKGHAEAYSAIHRIQTFAKVGLAHHFNCLNPTNRFSPFDQLAATTWNHLKNCIIPQSLENGIFRFFGTRKYLKEALGTQDYFGLSYITSNNVAFSLRSREEMYIKSSFSSDADLSPSKVIANDPSSFFNALKWAKRFKLPIIITENGTEDPGNNFRNRYLIEHISMLWKAVNLNWKIIGYFHRSLVDSFEWNYGWSRPFGMWQLDRISQERRKRICAHLYSSICQENALSSELVKEYAPEVFDKLFPT